MRTRLWGDILINTIENQIDEYILQNRHRLINSIILYKNDDIIFERYYNKYSKDSRNNIKSIWKSILSILIGICLDKGLINSVDDKISIYLDEFNTRNHPYHKLTTIEHLLTMTSGIYWNGGRHYHCPMLEQMFRANDWVEHISDITMSDVPGRKHTYKEWDVVLLSAIISKVTGDTAHEFCRKNLYEPLGIQSGVWAEKNGVSYTISPDDYKEKASDLSARDLAKIGKLFLKGGLYNSECIVSSDYIEKAVTPSTQDPNYGYLWWIIKDGYGCRGYGGQDISVIPKDNLVYVMQATPTPRAKSYDDVREFLLTVL